ncbi:hypothetical protein NDU88_006883 [Pleurodeles waltl]|uniref:Uncharacterized protein n=1 Tax=Pleurodeles waltl TaxID=8319 RepID=A0AAV7WF93_PLEWA|nr:hypothetical protein NDU88_006883 [Pleurodeles waltl]
MRFWQQQHTGRRTAAAPEAWNLDQGRRFSAQGDFRGPGGAARGITSILGMTAPSPRTFEAPCAGCLEGAQYMMPV